MAESDQDKQPNQDDDAQGTRGEGDTEPQPGQGDERGKGGDDSQTETQPPAKGVAIKLTPEQREALSRGEELVLPDEVYSGAVQQRISAYTARAKAAEEKVAALEAQRAEEERKQLEEQQRFKELYEKERAEREKEAAARAEEALRSRFMLAAAKANVVDPEAAYVLARALDEWAEVKLGEDGKAAGLDETLQALIESKPYLVSQQQKKTSVGSASNPGDTPPPQPKTLAEAGDALERSLRSGA